MTAGSRPRSYVALDMATKAVEDTARALQKLLSGFRVDPFTDFSAPVKEQIHRLLRGLPGGLKRSVSVKVAEEDHVGPKTGFVHFKVGNDVYVINKIISRVFMPCKIEEITDE